MVQVKKGASSSKAQSDVKAVLEGCIQQLPSQLACLQSAPQRCSLPLDLSGVHRWISGLCLEVQRSGHCQASFSKRQPALVDWCSLLTWGLQWNLVPPDSTLAAICNTISSVEAEYTHDLMYGKSVMSRASRANWQKIKCLRTW